jgi:hypothetical protein
VQGRQECRFGVDGGLQRRGDPHRVWPERLEQESERAEVSSKAHNSGSRFSGKIAVTGLSRVAGAASGFSRSLL